MHSHVLSHEFFCFVAGALTMIAATRYLKPSLTPLPPPPPATTYNSPAAAGRPPGDTMQTFSVQADSYNQCYVTATMGNRQVPIKFLMDSGASGELTIGDRDAQRIGIDTSNLNYNVLNRTANGYSHSANVEVNNFRLGTFSLPHVTVDVFEQSGNFNPTPLMGAIILKSVNFQVRPGYCTITAPKPAAAPQAQAPRPAQHPQSYYRPAQVVIAVPAG